MIQYLSTLPIIIKNKDGAIRKVIDFRRRKKYNLESIYLEQVEGGEELRLDLIAQRIYKNIFYIEYLIDVNDIDLLSKNTGDELRFTTDYGYR